jgi:hypothetical protein
VTAKDVEPDLLRARKSLYPGATVTGLASVCGWKFRLHVEIRANRVWRPGRPFLLCACRRRRTRLFLPLASHNILACRTCLGLAFSSRTLWNYRDSGCPVLGLPVTKRRLAQIHTCVVPRRRAEAARRRQAERRLLRGQLQRH